MFLSKKFLSFSLYLLLLSLILLSSQVACSPVQDETILSLVETTNDEVDQSLQDPSDLVFAGQVESDDKEWQNGYVVVLFEDGIEVDRKITCLLYTSPSPRDPE